MNTNQPADFKCSSAQREIHGRDRHGFTLTELLVVLATVGILAAMLLPALANNQPGSTKAFQCLNNMRQLGLAWLLYANDNHDRLVTNSDRNNSPFSTQNWICPGGVVLDWSASSNNTNAFWLTGNNPIIGTALLGSAYVAKSVNIFVCPSDNKLSNAQRSLGWTNRIRTCAMNGAMGDGSKYFGFRADGTPNAGHAGRWTSFYTAKKLTDLHSPGPSDCFVMMDEHPDSDDDATFFVCPADADGTGTSITELPGSLHGNTAGIVYADGHSDLHKWRGILDTPPVIYQVYVQSVSISGDTAALNDLVWMAQHTPAN